MARKSVRRYVVVAVSAAMLATGAAGATGLTGLTASAGAAPASASANSAPTGYVRAEPVCSRPTRTHPQCMSMRLVRTTSKAVGARPLAARASYPTGLAGGYTPADLATAYGMNAAGAASPIVGIVDAYDDPNALTDLKAFDKHYGLPAETASSFKKVSGTGSTTTFPAADAGWAGEISLDLDAVRGLCHACRIVLVEATTNSYADFAVAEKQAVTQGASVVSNSWGGAESGAIPSYLTAAFTHPGTVFLASTADHGMYDWDLVNASHAESAGPAVPSSLNTVVAVGGTSLYLNSNATRSGETVWNNNGSFDQAGGNRSASLGATGGGCSTRVTAKPWQKAVANYSETGCASKRLAGDISALADPYTGYDVYDTYQSGGWQTYGGTSLASPLIAAMWALAGGSGGVAYPSQSLYQHFASNPSVFNDVTTGGNGFCGGASPQGCTTYWGFTGSPNVAFSGTVDCAWGNASATRSVGTRACDAATGYDGPSGVGTPKGLTGFTPA